MIFSNISVTNRRRLLATSEPGSVSSSSQEVRERKTPSEGASRSLQSSAESEKDVGSELSNSKKVEDGLVLIMAKARLYIRTFKLMFGRQDCSSAIKQLALYGHLGDNPFRSLCWRVLLTELPSTSLDWIKAMHSHRTNYQFLKAKFHIEERMKDVTLDPVINNPLSQAQDSPWNQHFQDKELRRVIEQDVVRTFPEVEFFQNNLVRDTMVNILFIYARCHPEIGYKQGMHELLAPLYYVLKTDCDKFSDITDSLKDNKSDESAAIYKDLKNVIKNDVFNEKFCEADSFSLFESLMKGMGPWFISNKVVDSLDYIQNVLLKRHDPALLSRLEELEILPQMYGIRWLRLLFGREFVFRDTLLLWDTIFADSNLPGLCDQLVVSLLMALRDKLLEYEYHDAVQLLMKHPSDLNVTYCTQFALHLKDPRRFAEPIGPAFTQEEVVKADKKEEKEVIEAGSKLRKLSAPRIFSRMFSKMVLSQPNITRNASIRKSTRISRNSVARKTTRIARNPASRKSKKVVGKEACKA